MMKSDIVFDEKNMVEVDYMKKKNVSPEETNKLHYHTWHEMIVVDKGCVVYTSNNGVVRIAEKSIVFMPAHTLHNPFVQGGSPYERYRIKFSRNFADGMLASPSMLGDILKEPYIKQLGESEFEEIFWIVKSLFCICNKEERRDIDRLSICNHLIMIIMKGASAVQIQSAPHIGYISEVAEYIKNNFNKPLTIDMLASQFYISRSKLIYDFKNYCRMSILEYIIMLRVERAKELLLKGYSVSAVSEECGFSSPSYFIKVFSGITGITPLKFQIKYNPF